MTPRVRSREERWLPVRACTLGQPSPSPLCYGFFMVVLFWEVQGPKTVLEVQGLSARYFTSRA